MWIHSPRPGVGGSVATEMKALKSLVDGNAEYQKFVHGLGALGSINLNAREEGLDELADAADRVLEPMVDRFASYGRTPTDIDVGFEIARVGEAFRYYAQHFHSDEGPQIIATDTKAAATEWVEGDFRAPTDAEIQDFLESGEPKHLAERKAWDQSIVNGLRKTDELSIITFEPYEVVVGLPGSYHRSPVNNTDRPVSRYFAIVY